MRGGEEVLIKGFLSGEFERRVVVKLARRVRIGILGERNSICKSFIYIFLLNLSCEGV